MDWTQFLNSGESGQLASFGASSLNKVWNMFLDDSNTLLMNNWVLDQQADQYRSLYSPQARMRDMRDAHINPYTAAQGIAGSGSGGSGMSVSGAPVQDSVAQIQSLLAQSELTYQQSEGQVLQNYITDQTKEDIIKNAGYNTQILGSYAYIANYDMLHYPEFYSKTMAKLDNDIKLSYNQGLYYDAMSQYYDGQIQLISYQKSLLEAQAGMYGSQDELNQISYELTRINVNIAYWNALKAKTETDRYIRSGNMPEYVQMYDYITDTQGQEAAEVWKNEHYSLAQQWQESVAKGQSQGSDPYLAGLWTKYDTIQSAQDEVDNLISMEKDAYDEVQKALQYGTSEEYLAKQKAYDNLVKTINESKKSVEEAQKAFEKGNEFRGYRDPNKFYKDDWIRIGSEVAKDLTTIYGVTRGKTMPVKNSNSF